MITGNETDEELEQAREDLSRALDIPPPSGDVKYIGWREALAHVGYTPPSDPSFVPKFRRRDG